MSGLSLLHTLATNQPPLEFRYGGAIASTDVFGAAFAITPLGDIISDTGPTRWIVPAAGDIRIYPGAFEAQIFVFSASTSVTFNSAPVFPGQDSAWVTLLVLSIEASVSGNFSRGIGTLRIRSKLAPAGVISAPFDLEGTDP
jgi:hypothetical protein